MPVSMIPIILVGCSWLVPDHIAPWTSFHTEVPAFFAVLLMYYIYWRSSQQELKVSVAAWPLLLLIASPWIQWGLGHLSYVGDAVIASLYLTAFTLAWFFGHHGVQINKQTQWSLVEQISLVVLFVGLVVSLQIFVQWLKIEVYFRGWILEGLPTGRMRANVGQPNQAATTVLMAIVAAVVLFCSKRLGGRVCWLSVVVLTWAMVLTQSRTALLSCLVILVILNLLLSRRLKLIEVSIAIERRQLIFWLLLVIGMTWVFQVLELIGVTGGAGLKQLAQPGTRTIIWTQIVIAILEKPWLGYGWLQIPAAQQFGALNFPGAEQTNYAHNIILDLFAMLGVPIGLLVVSGAGYFFWSRIDSVRESIDAIFALFILVPFGVHCNLEFPHAYAYFIVLAGLLLGVIDAKTQTRFAKKTLSFKKIILGLGLFWSGLLMLTGYEYVLVEEDFRINRFENRRVGTTPSDYVPPRPYLLTQMGEMLMSMRMRAQPNMTQSDLEVLIRTSNRYSWAPLQFRTALALALNGRFKESEHQLRTIKGLFSEEIYNEAKETLIRMRQEKYPELIGLTIP